MIKNFSTLVSIRGLVKLGFIENSKLAGDSLKILQFFVFAHSNFLMLKTYVNSFTFQKNLIVLNDLFNCVQKNLISPS